jgi:hypothetical protein
VGVHQPHRPLVVEIRERPLLKLGCTLVVFGDGPRVADGADALGVGFGDDSGCRQLSRETSGLCSPYRLPMFFAIKHFSVLPFFVEHS